MICRHIIKCVSGSTSAILNHLLSLHGNRVKVQKLRVDMKRKKEMLNLKKFQELGRITFTTYICSDKLCKFGINDLFVFTFVVNFKGYRFIFMEEGRRNTFSCNKCQIKRWTVM